VRASAISPDRSNASIECTVSQSTIVAAAIQFSRIKLISTPILEKDPHATMLKQNSKKRWIESRSRPSRDAASGERLMTNGSTSSKSYFHTLQCQMRPVHMQMVTQTHLFSDSTNISSTRRPAYCLRFWVVNCETVFQ
jgi:hypothetical protein